MRYLIKVSLLVIVLTGCAASPPPSQDVIGIEAAHLTPDYWIRRAGSPNKVVLDPAQIARQNSKLQTLDPSVHRIEDLPGSLDAAQIKQWIMALSTRPTKTLYDAQSREVAAQTLDELIASLNLEAIPATQTTRFALITRRADLRTFPTRLRVFSSSNDTDIDRFQESALFPGTPVAVVHESLDKQWWFVVSPLYAAWIEKGYVAEGSRQQVFDYSKKQPHLVITGATARTVFTPDLPEVSDVQLEMGVRVPLITNWPANQPVNGQHPYAAHIIELPIRKTDGSLAFAPALVPKTADVSSDYLPLNQANLLRQSFKFLGERYGWGHSYNARDCSGFVSEVYRSFGVQLPRNTRDQGVSPALNRLPFSEQDSHEARLAALRSLQVGDLIYVPGHVMMVIGHDRGMPYIIHDTTGISFRADSGETIRLHLNGVSVTPLEPLLLVDRIYSITKIRP
jgi:cell wall-associated NlpC family hydrolase